MKRILAALVVTLMLAGNVYAAKALRFTWGYDTAEEAHIDGFRLYEEGVAIKVEPPFAREFIIPYIEDRKARTYYATAFAGDEESAPSDTATAPAFIQGVKKMVSGSFTMEIIEVP